LTALSANKIRVGTTGHLPLLHHPSLLLEFLLLLHPISIHNIQWMLVCNEPILHVHIVYLITIIGVLNGSPGFGHGRLETLHCDPQQVLVRVDVQSEILRVLNDF
jgi:hypothetical protein